MKLILDYPISANRYWRTRVMKTHRGYRAQTYVSAEAKAYKAEIESYCRHKHIEPLSGDVIVCIDFYRPQRSGDIDNFNKVLLDALQGLAFANDSQVVELHTRRFEDKSNPRAEVSIEEIAA